MDHNDILAALNANKTILLLGDTAREFCRESKETNTILLGQIVNSQAFSSSGSSAYTYLTKIIVIGYMYNFICN